MAPSKRLAVTLPYRGTWHQQPEGVTPVAIAADLARRNFVEDTHAFVQATREDMRKQPMFATVAEWLGNRLVKEKATFLEGLDYYRDVVALDGERWTIMNNLAYYLSTSPDDSVRNGAEAVKWAERAAEITGGRNASILDTLSCAYAEAGRFADAAATAKKGLAVAASPAEVAELRKHLALFEKQQPVRQ